MFFGKSKKVVDVTNNSGQEEKYSQSGHGVTMSDDEWCDLKDSRYNGVMTVEEEEEKETYEVVAAAEKKPTTETFVHENNDPSNVIIPSVPYVDTAVQMMECLAENLKLPSEKWKFVVLLCVLGGFIGKSTTFYLNDHEQDYSPIAAPAISEKDFIAMFDGRIPSPDYAKLKSTHHIPTPNSDKKQPSSQDIMAPREQQQPEPYHPASAYKEEDLLFSLSKRIEELQAVNAGYLERLSRMAIETTSWRSLAIGCDEELKVVTESRDALQEEIQKTKRLSFSSVFGMKSKNVKKPMGSPSFPVMEHEGDTSFGNTTMHNLGSFASSAACAMNPSCYKSLIPIGSTALTKAV